MTLQDDCYLIASIIMYFITLPLVFLSMERLTTFFSNPITNDTMMYAIQPMILGIGLCFLTLAIMAMGVLIDS